MKREVKDQMAFMAASMAILADMSGTELGELTQIIGIEAIKELMAMKSLRFELSFEDMAGEICTYTGWEPALFASSYDAIMLDKFGRQIADLVSVFEPAEDVLAERLCAVLCWNEVETLLPTANDE